MPTLPADPHRSLVPITLRCALACVAAGLPMWANAHPGGEWGHTHEALWTVVCHGALLSMPVTIGLLFWAMGRLSSPKRP